MRLQLGPLARQDPLGHQEHPAGQDKLVLLDPKDREVLQAIQVHLDNSAILDIQVINHRTENCIIDRCTRDVVSRR